MSLVLSFDTEELQAVCENDLQAKQKLTVPVASALQKRLADLASATTVSDLVVGKPAPFKDQNNDEVFGVDLDDGYKLIFCSAHVTSRVLSNGEIDWAKTKRIKILRIAKQ